NAPVQQATIPCPRVTVTAPPISAFCNISPNPINLGAGATLTAGAIGGVAPIQFLLPGSGNYGSSNSTLVLPQQTGSVTYQISGRDSIGQTSTNNCSVQVNGVAPTVTGLSWDSTPH